MNARAGKRARRRTLVGPQAPLDGGRVDPAAVVVWGGAGEVPARGCVAGGAVMAGLGGAVGEIFLTL